MGFKHELARVDVAETLIRTIDKSFDDDGSRRTMNETRRRFEICVKIYETLRGDAIWSVRRILDYLPIYLRNELDGVPWQPARGKVWSRRGIREIEIERRLAMRR